MLRSARCFSPKPISRSLSRIGTFTLHRSSNDLECVRRSTVTPMLRCAEVPCSINYGASVTPCNSSDARQIEKALIRDRLLARAMFQTS
jgi:hypothetical protein